MRGCNRELIAQGMGNIGAARSAACRSRARRRSRCSTTEELRELER
jgi:hypothetical protein